jgi:hypothetical protein
MSTDEASGVLPVQPVRAIQDPPVVFCDGVMSQSFATGISKFYLFRTDASPDVSEGNKTVPILQIVMSANGFASMLHFFNHRLQLMVRDGAISQESVGQINKFVYSDPRQETINTSNPKRV